MYRSLQAGRAIAAILVVLFHVGAVVSAEKYFGIKALSVPFSFGNSGVQFFFVLSGFIILSAHRHDLFKPGRAAAYMKKRCIRIYPTYWIIFSLVFLMAVLSPSVRDTVQRDPWILTKGFFLIPQDLNVVGGTGAPGLGVAWTLPYEMCFYLYFAFLILSRWLAIVSGIAVLLFYLYANYLGDTASLPFPFSFVGDDNILLFVMGMAVCLINESKRMAAKRPLVYAAAGVVMFLAVGLDIVAGLNLLERWRTILYGLGASVAVFGLVQAEDKGRVVGGNRLMQTLGDASYALYLIHFPLISILCKLFVAARLNRLGAPGALIAYLAIFGACLSVSVIFHRLVERPVGACLRNRLLRPSAARQDVGPDLSPSVR